MSKEQKVTLKEWLYITIGILIMTLGIYFFKFPNHFSTGGVTGIELFSVIIFRPLHPVRWSRSSISGC